MTHRRRARYVILIDGDNDIFLRRIIPDAEKLLSLSTEPVTLSKVPRWVKKIYYADDTLWKRCFWEEYEEVKRNGGDTIVFENVDRRVIEKSKLPDTPAEDSGERKE